MRRRLFRRKCHTNVKNGGAEWMEGRRKPVEVVCVDSAMTAGGGRNPEMSVIAWSPEITRSVICASTSAPALPV